MKNEKIQKTFIDRGFGFEVRLLNVPMIQVRGVWTPNIDYNLLTEGVLKVLCEKLGRLTGNEIRFIRLHYGMTLQQFAKRFSVSHAAVIKWEKTGNRATAMQWPSEKDLRLFLLLKLSKKARDLINLYEKLETAKKDLSQTIQLDVGILAA